MNVDYGAIGQRIKQVRRSRDMTQERLAEALSVSVGYISQIERGVTKINWTRWLRWRRTSTVNFPSW